MIEVKYSSRKQNRVETDDVIIYVRRDIGYVISVTDKKTNTVKYKAYQKKESINNTANKYGVNFSF